MPRTLISTGTRFERLASYSRAVIDGDMIYLSGTVGFDPKTHRIPEDVVAQTEQAFRTIAATLREAGAALADVLRVRVFIADRRDLLPVCRVVGRRFRRIRPANTTVCTPLATPEMKVEIEVTARRRSGDRSRPRRRPTDPAKPPGLRAREARRRQDPRLEESPDDSPIRVNWPRTSRGQRPRG